MRREVIVRAHMPFYQSRDAHALVSPKALGIFSRAPSKGFLRSQATKIENDKQSLICLNN